MTRRGEALKWRLQGLTYHQVGVEMEISRQRVQQLLSPPKGVRTIVVTRAKGCCQDCGLGVGDSGHVHHRSSTNGDTYDDIDNLELLCVSCHAVAHEPYTRSNDLPSGGSGSINLNTTQRERESYVRAAEAANLTLSGWIRLHLDKVAKE